MYLYAYTNIYTVTDILLIQWSLYFKPTHGTKKMWSYTAGGLELKVI